MANQTIVFLSELRKKVEAGLISKLEAEKLAVAALQEVAEAEPEAPAEPSEKEPKAAKEEAPEVANEDVSATPPAPSVEPKSVILAALTKFEQAISPAFKAFQEEINKLLKETANAAVPIGDFSIDAEELNAKVTIAQKDKNALVCTYRLKNDWQVDGVDLSEVTANFEESSCHLGIRRDLLAVAEEILAHSQSNEAWRKYEIPREDLQKIRQKAQASHDARVLEATENTLRTSTAKSWQGWALATLTQLLGSDYVKEEGKSFKDLKSQF